MKIKHTIELNGTKATFVFEVLPEGFEILHGHLPDSSSVLDTDWPFSEEVFRSIRMTEKAQDALRSVHGELYQNLVNSSLGLLTNDL
ncbi:MAG: hypothetical protein ACPHSA_09380 [Cycloclasticus pugetii]|uniref:hypothetical protein n=1 Tax=Cycloclasticus TaxID=34067 RepID=UPI000286AB20|nr:hypothetical protein [Cycloclasticus sp. P1]AFT67376.1 hypothetical protein Q91_1339 [Cycloclasticus sp. P1]